MAGSTGRRLLVLATALGVTGTACLVVALTQQRTTPFVPLAVPVPAVAVPASVVPSTSPRAAAAARTAIAAPTRLTIPAIHVRSDLLTLGQAPDGTLETPPPGAHYDQAGWYRYSPRPGGVGPAVIVGHIDSKTGGPSVFFRLGELRPGDLVEVARADGSVAVFAVAAVRRFHKADFPTRLVYGNTDHAALRLITCGGPFDRATGHYTDNIVVSASLVRTR